MKGIRKLSLLLIVCIVLMAVPRQVYADTTTTSAGKEKTAAKTEYTDPAEFIEALRAAIDARHEAEPNDEEAHAKFNVEKEMMAEYADAVFEDEALNELAALYYAASDTITRSEIFEDERYFGALEDAGIQEYAIAILNLWEHYELPLDEDEISELRDYISWDERKIVDYSDKNRVTIGHYSYLIPEDLSYNKEMSDNEQWAYTDKGETRGLMIMYTDMSEEIGGLSSLAPMILDMAFESIKEEIGAENTTISDFDFLGYRAKRISGKADIEGEAAVFDMFMTIADTDLIAAIFFSRDADGLEDLQLEMDKFIDDAAPAPDESTMGDQDRIIIGSYSYLPMEGLSYLEEHHEEGSWEFANADETEMMLIMEESMDTAFGKDVEVTPELLDSMLEDASAEFDTGLDIKEYDFFGSPARLGVGKTTFEDKPACLIFMIALTDTDAVAITYALQDSDDTKATEAKFEEFLSNIEPAE